MSTHSHDRCYWHDWTQGRSFDFVIIGGGFVGMYAALAIRSYKPKASIVILDRLNKGAMASSRNAGFACIGSITELIDNVNTYGFDNVREIVKMRYDGLAVIKEKFGKTIEYNTCGGYELFENSHLFEQAADQLGVYNNLLKDITDTDTYSIVNTPHQMRLAACSILNNHEGHLHTGKYFDALRKQCAIGGIEVLLNAHVHSFDEHESAVMINVAGMDEPMKASFLINCTNSLNPAWVAQHGFELTPVRNQVIVTRDFGQAYIRGTFHQDEGYIYFRDIGNRILIGGARNRFEQENTGVLGANSNNQQFLLDILRQYILPKGIEPTIDYAWSGVLSGGKDRRPIIQRTSERIAHSLRLGGMGVAIAPIIGKQVADIAIM